MHSILKFLASCAWLCVVAISLQGCGGCFHKEAIKKCVSDAMAAMEPKEQCKGWQAKFECMRDCCDEKASEVNGDCPECGDKTVKEFLSETITAMEAPCADLQSPCP
eukprot:gnl/TRDRNA2_/TRDRNA2_54831_c1_seq1.p2 gnl/TRDRNA2_/TRDRNA2_54831_c1~~gnl/TRDRNA2_/TRDRNA2_54831_c1_seq1.p2  ORF type:complete len:107 (-),score=27.94 gnl/TRDRNA2_/TRDRNA2_54831_c1_seq1:15-335(-)